MTMANRSSTRVFRTIHPRPQTAIDVGPSWLKIQVASEEATVGIQVSNLAKRYGAFQAICDVSFDVIAGQLVALLGSFRIRQKHDPANHRGTGNGRHRKCCADG